MARAAGVCCLLAMRLAGAHPDGAVAARYEHLKTSELVEVIEHACDGARLPCAARVDACWDAAAPRQAMLDVIATLEYDFPAPNAAVGAPVAEGAEGAEEALPCTIERRISCPRRGVKGAVGCLSAADFDATYVGKAPVLVAGLTQGWVASKHWASAGAFLRRHAGFVVGVKDAGDLVLGGPGAASAQLPLAEAATEGLFTDDGLFVFDQLDRVGADALLADFRTPRFGKGLKAMSPPPGSGVGGAAIGARARSWHMLSLGGPGAGLGWHMHG